ncbi:MAG: RagB/SusD family nutrient uptake outer membrane protein [Prevotella sp.]|nr:RagB/SusD family nutrient uptake outer membrane protein [Prevotella sp.]MDY5258639.1 RagB/SusD family nutrient uptake outer membrane protein [Prevotella sp.]
MKAINNKMCKRLVEGVLLASISMITMTTLNSCSDDFLADKRPFGTYGYEQVYYDLSSLNLRLNYIYTRSLPNHKTFKNSTDNFYPDLWPVGGNDFLSQHTEEFGGYGELAEPGKVWDNTNIQRFFFYGINESPWKKIRECTDVDVRLFNTDASILTNQQKAQGASQARFFRATRYFRLWKRYGGLPIVNTIQSTLSSDADKLALYRTSSDSTFRFMMEDLIYAGENLPTRWDEEANNWGRITSGAAYALAGYIANYWASPVFNRGDDKSRWEYAYSLNKKAIEQLDAGGFGLSYEGNPGTNASNWAKIWGNVYGGEQNKSEAVFFAVCNNLGGDASDQQYNNWEQAIRPYNAMGGQSITPTAEMVDLFPMADGKRPGDTSGKWTYNKNLFFLNRDPRFYRTFAFPGTEWRFQGVTNQPDQCPYASGDQYQLQNYNWYDNMDDFNDSIKTGYGSDLMGTHSHSIYIRKKSQDASLGMSPMYNFDAEQGFSMNAQPAIYMRYTEVLLNLAEAACGCDKLDEAWNILKRIRQRVGYEGDCGLNPSIRSNRAKMFEALLYERQIELAYEGKRFDDCHRWMLFDGGVGQEQLGSDMALTGWGGNTCKWLGVKPLNSIISHEIEICVSPSIYVAPYSSDKDPFSDSLAILKKPKALTLNEDFTTVPPAYEGAEETYKNARVKALAEFYQTNLVRKDVCTMTVSTSSSKTTGTELSVYPQWLPQYYFLGLQTGDQDNNPNVVQTIGWVDRYGGSGTYNPVSSNPVLKRP